MSNRVSPRPLPKIHLFLWRDFLASFWRLFSACFAPPRGKHATKPSDWLGGGGGGTLCIWLGLAHFHNGFSFLMISPNLLDIWPLFLLIPARFWHYLGFQVMAILCWAAKNSLRLTVLIRYNSSSATLLNFWLSKTGTGSWCGFTEGPDRDSDLMTSGFATLTKNMHKASN